MQHETEPLNCPLILSIKNEANGHFLQHLDDVLGVAVMPQGSLQYMEIMKSVGTVSLSSIKP